MHVQDMLQLFGVYTLVEILSKVLGGNQLHIGDLFYGHTVKPVLIKISGRLKRDKIKVLMENGSLMKVESILECSPWSILQYF